MKFNEKLIELRKKAGFSQEQLGDKLEVARQTVSKWELGNTTPEMDKLIKISEIFNVSLDELIGKENKQEKTNITGRKSILKRICILIVILVAIYLMLVLRRFILIKKLYNDISKLKMDGYMITTGEGTYADEDSENAKKEIVCVKGESIQSLPYESSEDDKSVERREQIIYANKNTGEAYSVNCDDEGNTIKEEKGTKYINYNGYYDEYEIINRMKTAEQIISKAELYFDIFNTKITYLGDSYYDITKHLSNGELYLRYGLGENGYLDITTYDKVSGERNSKYIDYLPIYDNFEETSIEKPDIEGVEFETYDCNEDLLQ